MSVSPSSPLQPHRVAVIGSGITGLGASWLLAQSCRVSLYEAQDRPGGHTNTVTLPWGEAVDTGFIVYNERTYPNLIALFEILGVPTKPSDMSFGVSLGTPGGRGGTLEYAGDTLGKLFAQPGTLLSPRHWRMVADVMRFFREGRALLETGINPALTLGAFLRDSGYGAGLIEDHLVPMAAAIWSTPPQDIFDFPLAAFLRFFQNHGLLQVRNRPRWRTVEGGGITYVRAILDRLPAPIQLDRGASSIRRTPQGVVVHDCMGQSETFDDVVLACHADEALALLDAPTAAEHAVLGAFRFQPNEAVLHTDPALMPRRRRVWSSWSYMSADRIPMHAHRATLTYWMNRLQGLDPARDVFVSLNPHREPDPATEIARFSYTHPLMDGAALAAQRRWWEIQGAGGVWFCGAWCGSGFHEDGLQAGLAVAERLAGMRRPWQVKDEAARVGLSDGAAISAHDPNRVPVVA